MCKIDNVTVSVRSDIIPVLMTSLHVTCRKCWQQ